MLAYPLNKWKKWSVDMNNKTKLIMEELKKAGFIKNDADLTANVQTKMIFDYMVEHYSFLLDPMREVSLPDSYLNSGKFLHEIIMKFGKYFLKSPQIIENRAELLENDREVFPDECRQKLNLKVKIPNEPVVFLTNHGFKDDVLATLLAAQRRAFIIFGSLPQFYGTIDGLLSAKNGVIMVDRKVDASKTSSVEKGKYALAHGMSLMVCPEGVWNKKPNGGMLEFWSGFYRMAQKEDGTFYPIVPIIHYISNTYEGGKDNPIHTIVDDPIILDGMSPGEGITYVRTRMLTWYWKLMEKYGCTNRESLLENYDNAVEAWEDELRKRVATADRYDIEIETTADKRRKDDLTAEQLLVWEPIANLDENRYNCLDVEYARKLVKEIKQNDFQHRF